MIMGPPGSGKTLVLAAMVNAFVKQAEADSEPVLFTCFNKAIINQIYEWKKQENTDNERYNPVKWFVKGEGYIEIHKYSRVKAILINFDKLPTIFAGHPRPNGISFEKELSEKIKKSSLLIGEIKPEDLITEFKVHYYGKAQLNYEKYLEIDRNEGTGLSIPKGSNLRKCIGELFKSIKDEYIENRVRLYNSLLSENNLRRFRAILVDELQDMTDTDIQIMRGLALPRCLFVAAEDALQNVHTGAFYRRPQLLNGKKWNKKVLSTSYRTPFLIGKALQRIDAEYAAQPKHREELEEDYAKPGPTRLSFVGIRPILIRGGNEQDIADSIYYIVRHFSKSALGTIRCLS